MTRPFFSKDRITHFDIFDRCVFWHYSLGIAHAALTGTHKMR